LIVIRKLGFLITIATLSASAATASEPIGAEKILQSDFFQANTHEIISAAHEQLVTDETLSPEEKLLIARELDTIPFRRTLDVEIAFLSGVPDLVGVCLEAFPFHSQKISVEACASTIIVLSSLSANAKYRWELRRRNSNSGRTSILSLGPGVGVRKFATWCFDSCGEGVAIDAIGSLEYVRWISRKFGWSLQLDAGLMTTVYQNGSDINRFIPIARLTFGLTFSRDK
jgi:hypothetical protein